MAADAEAAAVLRMREEADGTPWLLRTYRDMPDDLYYTFPVDPRFPPHERRLGAVVTTLSGMFDAVGIYVMSVGEDRQQETKILITADLNSDSDVPRTLHLGQYEGDEERIAAELSTYDAMECHQVCIRALGDLHRQRMELELQTIRTLSLRGLEVIYRNLLYGVPGWEPDQSMQ